MVTRIQNILFPVDFSRPSAAMAAYVKRVAAICGARVALVHVFDLTGHNGFELYVRPLVDIEKEHRELARQKLDSFLKTEFPLGNCQRVLLSGDVAGEIAQFANTGGFDLIMMPTHAGSFRRMLLGSTTAKVLNDADCPVWTTQHAEGVVPRPMEHREWLCAIGLDADSERLLRCASGLASAAQARLSLVHVVPALAATLPIRSTVEEQELKVQQRIEELQRNVGCQVPVRIVAGPVKETLLEEARRSDADVLVVGRGPQPGMLGRIRDLTYTVGRDSPCPVASV